MTLDFICISSCWTSKLPLFSNRQVSRFLLRGLGNFANHPYSIGRSCCHLTAKKSTPPDGLHWHFLKKQTCFPGRLSASGTPLRSSAAQLGFPRSPVASFALLGHAWPGRGRVGPRLAPRPTSRRPRHPACGCMMPPSLADLGALSGLHLDHAGRRLDAEGPDITCRLPTRRAFKEDSETVSHNSVSARVLCLFLITAWQWNLEGLGQEPRVAHTLRKTLFIRQFSFP